MVDKGYYPHFIGGRRDESRAEWWKFGLVSLCPCVELGTLASYSAISHCPWVLERGVRFVAQYPFTELIATGSDIDIDIRRFVKLCW
jgi:hypothetical protein